ncbi:hypothetical protein E3P81_03345 [Wallemia ichthyophaga]|nr:hypothetical protein E3P97_03382 [Wallemia ichthyophaga]TIB29348.1 hypothetical protein E3P85_03207 [Wallemia ichthyophaga]TIB44777.1 hypothetical protein E3P82_03350 [Wallemia ichthyophaga]TIB47212.1 hypothetical protein E3P81_03345 [Wallemia ichthyophaga]TIB50185.1 hypothetical protein E3P80_03354 [Wallemia ichthyophaga]
MTSAIVEDNQHQLNEKLFDIDEDDQFNRFLSVYNRVESVNKYTLSFLSGFEKRDFTSTQQVKLISDFLSFIAAEMRKSNQFDDLDLALDSIDKLIHIKLYPRTFNPKFDDLAKDQVLEQRIRIFNWINLENLDLYFDLGETFKLATHQLHSINKYHCPKDKKLVILNTSIILTSILNNSPATTSADSLLPLFIYTLLQSNPQHLISNIDYIQRFTDSEQLSGEVGYYFYTITAAVSFISNLDHKALSNIDKEEFERRVAEAISQLPSTPPPSPIKSTPTTPQVNLANESRQMFQRTTQGIGKIGKLLGEVVEEGVDKLTNSTSPKRNGNGVEVESVGDTRREDTQLERSHSQYLEEMERSRQQFNKSLETLLQIFPHVEPGVCEMILNAEHGNLEEAVDKCLEVSNTA